MKTIDDGGQAFPVYDEGHHVLIRGASLRDWYAGMAMQGILASGTWCGYTSETEAIRASWVLADAMIAARKERPE